MSFREYLNEMEKELDDEFVMQKLADKDINSKIKGNSVFVDKSDMKEAAKILKSMGCQKKLETM